MFFTRCTGEESVKRRLARRLGEHVEDKLPGRGRVAQRAVKFGEVVLHVGRLKQDGILGATLKIQVEVIKVSALHIS